MIPTIILANTTIKIMSPSEYENFVSQIPEDFDRTKLYNISVAGCTLLIKLDEIDNSGVTIK